MKVLPLLKLIITEKDVCGMSVKVDSGMRYNHLYDRKYVGGTAGVDNSACGATWAAPCLSIKYAFTNRLNAGAGNSAKVVLASGAYFSGADNR